MSSADHSDNLLTDIEIYDIKYLITARSSFPEKEQKTLLDKLTRIKQIQTKLKELDIDDLCNLIIASPMGMTPSKSKMLSIISQIQRVMTSREITQ